MTSIRTCYEASSELVQYFVDAYDEFKPGGQIESEKWFLSSITWHDFLLGSTTLCLVVCALCQSNSAINIDGPGTLDLLRRSQLACIEQSKRNMHTRRAEKVVGATIALLEARYERGQYRPGDASLSANEYTSSGICNAQTGHHNAAQTLAVQPGGQENADTLGAFDWASDDNLSRPLEDPSWLYLEQYLNLSNTDEFMSDL